MTPFKEFLYKCVKTLSFEWRVVDGGTYRLQNSYVYYKLESKATSNFILTSKKLGLFDKNKNFMTNSIFLK